MNSTAQQHNSRDMLKQFSMERNNVLAKREEEEVEEDDDDEEVAKLSEEVEWVKGGGRGFWVRGN